MLILAKKNIFSDEAHFDLGEHVNKQNCRIWDTENPYAYIEKPTHPKRVTVWYGYWSTGIIGHFPSKMNKEGPLQSIAIVIGPCWTKFWRGRYWQHLVSKGLRYVPHNRSRRANVVIWHRSTIICRVSSKISVMPTNQKQLAL